MPAQWRDSPPSSSSESEAPVEAQLTPREIRQRAGAGVVAVAARGVFVNVLSLAGGIVLARLLLPRDFGVVAVGSTVVMLAYFLADAGVGATMIRDPTAPSRRDLEALLAFQLSATTILAALIAAIAWPFGEVGQVTALMCISLPFAALRTPVVVLLERRLSYRPIALVEISEVGLYYAWAIATVIAGWGVWGLASAAVLQAATGSMLMTSVCPERIVRPRFSWSRTRRLLGFGLRFQAVGGVIFARDQALNVGTALFAGVSVLGLWTVARRLLEAPFVLLAALWRISYPAMSRLLSAGELPRPIIERSVRLVAAGLGVLLVPLVGSAPALVPVLLGGAWTEAASVLPWAALGLMISGPISVAASGYLWAVGDARTPLRAAALDAFFWCAVSLPLVPLIGVSALGVGWLAGALAQSALLERTIARRTHAAIRRHLIVPTAVAVVATAAGWTVSSAKGENFASAAVGAVLAEALYIGGLLLLTRGLLGELINATGRALRASVARVD